MRRDIAALENIRTGQLVRVQVKLRRGQKFARVGLWSCIGPECDEYSPHTEFDPPEGAEGPPSMVQPTYFSLDIRGRTAASFEFRAGAHMKLRLVQEIDAQTETAPIGKLTRGRNRKTS